MKPTSPDNIRNVALISHGGAGKTSLAEAMLFDAGAIQRLGSVDAGTATLDFDPEEQKRGQSVNLAVGSLEHDGVRITIVDTPGYADFQADVVWRRSESSPASSSSTRWIARTRTTTPSSTS